MLIAKKRLKDFGDLVSLPDYTFRDPDYLDMDMGLLEELKNVYEDELPDPENKQANKYEGRYGHIAELLESIEENINKLRDIYDDAEDAVSQIEAAIEESKTE